MNEHVLFTLAQPCHGPDAKPSLYRLDSELAKQTKQRNQQLFRVWMGMLAVHEKLATTASSCNLRLLPYGDFLQRLAKPSSVLYSAEVLDCCGRSCSIRASMAQHIPVFLCVGLSFLHSLLAPGFQDQIAVTPWKLGPCSSSCSPRCSASHKDLSLHTATWGSLYLSPLARVAVAM